MDHSLRGYLSRRSKKELEQIIALYENTENSDFYAPIVALARHFLEKSIAENSEQN